MWVGLKCVHDGRHRINNSSLFKLQSQSCFDMRMDILTGERNEAEGEKKRKGEDNVTTGNVPVVLCLYFPCRYQERRVWYPNKTIWIVQEGNSPPMLLFALPLVCQRVSSSSPLSFALRPACLSELASEWFLAEMAAWTDSRWAKEEARLSFIQTLLWIAAGGWCIQIPQILSGLFSWWRPWGEGDGK